MKQGDEKARAVLAGCFVDIQVVDEFPYERFCYYFAPTGLLSEAELKTWLDDERNCLTTYGGMNRQESINHVQQWAKSRGIRITKAEINEAFKQ